MANEKTTVSIIPEDRQFAADYGIRFGRFGEMYRAAIEDGQWDDTDEVQLVARHRFASQACKPREGTDVFDARAEGRKILESIANGPRSFEYQRAAFRLIRQMDGTWYDPKEYGDDWLKVLVALTPDAVQAREAELLAFLEQILLYADPNGDGAFDGAGDIAGVKQNGALVLKGSFITVCARIRAALAAS